MAAQQPLQAGDGVLPTGTEPAPTAPMLSLPLNDVGDVRPTRPVRVGNNNSNGKNKKMPFVVREAALADLPRLAAIAAEAYRPSPVTRHLVPGMAAHWGEYVRWLRQGVRQKLVAPRTLSVVVEMEKEEEEQKEEGKEEGEKQSKREIIGFAQFSRLGTDRGARDFTTPSRRHLAQRLHLLLLAWCFWIADKLAAWLWPNRALDHEKMRIFGTWIVRDEERYWTGPAVVAAHPDRANRWFANIVVVDPVAQGRGVGRLLMDEVLRRAQAERVVVGLTSSAAGERLYRRMGFQKLGDFYKRFPFIEGEEQGGGIMIWYPEEMEKS